MVKSNITLPVESVRERDVDFLLVEELFSSQDFVAFLLQKLKLPKCDQLANVQRSVHGFGLGETDVLLEYKSEEKTIGVLIENKLDALFQPDQAARYDARAAQYVDSESFDETYSVLVAPQQYIDRQTEFQRAISYESIVRYFEGAQLGRRGEFKVMLLRIAIERLRRGYVAVNSEPNQAFWQAYYDHILERLPTVTMRPVEVVPPGSDWIDLCAGDYKFVHKLERGYIDFTNLREHEMQALERLFGRHTQRVAMKSATTLRLIGIPLVRMSPFFEQMEQVEKCMGIVEQALDTLQRSNDRQ